MIEEPKILKHQRVSAFETYETNDQKKNDLFIPTHSMPHSKNFTDFLAEKALDQEAIKFLQGKSSQDKNI